MIASLAILLVAVAFVTAKSSAANCFIDTNGHWAETFICWMKDNGISAGYLDGTFRPENAVTRAELSVLLGKMRSTGVVQINSGAPRNWTVNGNYASGYIQDYSNVSILRSSSASSSVGFQTSVNIPSSLYNSLMYLNSVKICYDFPNNAFITNVYVYHKFANDDTYHVVSDGTDISVDGCTTYNLTTGSIYGGEYMVVYLEGNFPTNADTINMHSTTVYLTPSISAAVAKESRESSETQVETSESGAAP